jgi:hypothetical protein
MKNTLQKSGCHLDLESHDVEYSCGLKAEFEETQLKTLTLLHGYFESFFQQDQFCF